MSEIKLEVGQRVLLRNGLVGVVELSPLKHPYRVQDYSLNPNGKFYGDGQECSCDVVEILPPEPKRHTYEKWANCYPDKAVWLSETRKQADEHANRDRIACVPITIPFVEGEGLP